MIIEYKPKKFLFIFLVFGIFRNQRLLRTSFKRSSSLRRTAIPQGINDFRAYQAWRCAKKKIFLTFYNLILGLFPSWYIEKIEFEFPFSREPCCDSDYLLGSRDHVTLFVRLLSPLSLSSPIWLYMNGSKA